MDVEGRAKEGGEQIVLFIFSERRGRNLETKR